MSFEFVGRIWRDPVWSKVIAAGILGAIATGATLAYKAPSKPTRPTLTATFNAFSDGQTMESFIDSHIDQIVYFDITFSDEDEHISMYSTSGEDGGVRRGTLDFSPCNHAEVDHPKNPGNLSECSMGELDIGVEFPPGKDDSGLWCMRLACHLRGYFVSFGCTGPYQGGFMCTIKAVNVEDALR